MAERRMFSKKVIDSDFFLDMPQTAQALYFHLAMRADDDGFVGNYKRIMRMIGANDDDYKVLRAKRFILEFDNGRRALPTREAGKARGPVQARPGTMPPRAA